jgi:MoxR-like ATPase
MTEQNNTSDVAAVEHFLLKIDQLKKEIKQVIVGQDAVIEQVLIAIFSGGHALLVGVPGLAKTLLVNTIAQSLGLSFNRIQFTPDLMPSDITGSEILDQNKQFQFVKGPLFANVVLADEINRTPPKTQSALLEAMQERIVTASGHRHELPFPFFVLATQNPIEQEGTYPLPEAQLDRFMFNIWVDYPSFEEEMEVVKTTTGGVFNTVSAVLTSEDIVSLQQLVRKIPVADNVIEYAVNLSHKTRPNAERASSQANEYFNWGAGPRASQYLIVAAKCHALLQGKYSPDIENVKAVAHPILRHRVVRNYKAEAAGLSIDQLISQIL